MAKECIQIDTNTIESSERDRQIECFPWSGQAKAEREKPTAAASTFNFSCKIQQRAGYVLFRNEFLARLVVYSIPNRFPEHFASFCAGTIYAGIYDDEA